MFCSRVVSAKMVKWRYCLFLAMLLLLPVRTATDEDEEDELEEDNDDDSNDADDEEEAPEKSEPRDRGVGRRAPPVVSQQPQLGATRTVPRRPLECYVCAYKVETQLKSCLDPNKHRRSRECDACANKTVTLESCMDPSKQGVHTMTCHSVEEKCFTSVTSKGKNYEAIVRGCRSNCVGSPEVTCCELNRCNSQSFAMPVVVPRALTANKSTKAIPQTVLFFVTVLLVLQTVVKVAIV